MIEEQVQAVVTDVKIPFWSMVVLMLKWSLASIPAALVLFGVASLITFAVGALFSTTFYSPH